MFIIFNLRIYCKVSFTMFSNECCFHFINSFNMINIQITYRNIKSIFIGIDRLKNYTSATTVYIVNSDITK